MEFLALIDVQWPADGDQGELTRTLSSESARVQELAAAGTLKRLWRVPGRWSNWSLWEATNASALDDALASLPMHPWLKITVHPLTPHPSDPGPSARGGPKLPRTSTSQGG